MEKTMKKGLIFSLLVFGLILASCAQQPLVNNRQLKQPLVNASQNNNQKAIQQPENTDVKLINENIEWKNIAFNGSALEFKYPARFCFDQIDGFDCRNLYVTKIEDMVSLGQTQKDSKSNGEFIDPILTIYYVNDINQNDAEKYLKDKYELSSAIQWTVDKNDSKVKITNNLAGSSKIYSNSKNYAAYSEELKTLVSFSLPLACLFDCQTVDNTVLKSIKIDGVGIYNEDWQAYNNKSSEMLLYKNMPCTFSFKYPQGWFLNETLGGIVISSSSTIGSLTMGLVPKEELQIEIVPECPSERSGEIKDWCREIAKAGHLGAEISQEKNIYITIAGIKAYSLDFVYPTDKRISGRYICIPMANKNRLLLVANPLDSEQINIFQQIVDSLDFQS